MIRDYGHLLRDDPRYAAKAARVAALACDLSELLDRIGLPPTCARARRPLSDITPLARCSTASGSQTAPARLLDDAGFEVRVPQDAHLCCGSAGVYNILQPEIAARLGARKAQALGALAPDVIATGNIGCMVQIGAASGLPVAHRRAAARLGDRRAAAGRSRGGAAARRIVIPNCGTRGNKSQIHLSMAL